MAKTLCDWTKGDLERHALRLAKLVREPKFYCRKCARVAHDAQVLCKPCELPALDLTPSLPDAQD